MLRLNPKKLTLNGGDWMPVLEPVVDYLPNDAVLGYQRDEIINAHLQPGKPWAGSQKNSKTVK